MACAEIMEDSNLARFRTKMCRRHMAEGCEFGQRCQYSHNGFAQRRCPFLLLNKIPHNILRYLPIMCPETKLIMSDDDDRLGSYQCDPENCKRGVGCPFSHSFEEILFHPLMYKQKLCESYHTASSKCNEYYCSFVHDLSEKRHIPSNLYQLAPSIIRQLTFPLTRPLNLLKTYNSTEKQVELKPGKSSFPYASDALSSILTKATNIEGETLLVAAPYKHKHNSLTEKTVKNRLISVLPGDVFEVLMESMCKQKGSELKGCKVFFAKCIKGSALGTVGWIPASIMFGVDEEKLFPQEKSPSQISDHVHADCDFDPIKPKQNKVPERYFDLLSQPNYCDSVISKDQLRKNENSDQSDFTIPMYKVDTNNSVDQRNEAIKKMYSMDNSAAVNSLTTFINADQDVTNTTRRQASLWNLFASRNDIADYNQNLLFGNIESTPNENIIVSDESHNLSPKFDESEITSERPYPTLLGMESYGNPAVVNRQYDRITLLSQRSSISSGSSAANRSKAAVQNTHLHTNAAAAAPSSAAPVEDQQSIKTITNNNKSDRSSQSDIKTVNDHRNMCPDDASATAAAIKNTMSQDLSKKLDQYKLLHHLVQAEKEIQQCISIAQNLLGESSSSSQLMPPASNKSNLISPQSPESPQSDTQTLTVTSSLITLLKKILSSSEINQNYPTLLEQITVTNDGKDHNKFNNYNHEMKTPTVVQRLNMVPEDLKTHAISTASTTDHTVVLNFSNQSEQS